MVDLIAIIEHELRAMPPRGDEHLAHASDVVCDRATWARRKGETMLDRDFRTLMKFELGRQFERGIADILTEHFTFNGYKIERDVACEISGVVGHADFVAWPSEEALVKTMAEPFLLEIKSTSFLRGKVPDEPASWYVEQTAVYAAALNIARFGILIGCRESGKLAPVFWFSLDEQKGDEPMTWRTWAEYRANEIFDATNPAAPMPPAEPRTSWACKTCLWAGCEKNPGYEAAFAAMEASL